MEFICSSTEPIVQTKYGKLRGYKLDGIYTFEGIPYGQAKRFHFPTPLDPWDGVKDATQYGDTAPWIEKKVNGFGNIRIPHRYWPQDEACLYLNVWSSDLTPVQKKPVMLWIHGGGFENGSSVELACYEGANAARYGDVVLVSLNHRLNIAGYLDLSEYGDQYRNSGCAGIADLVLALEWVRDNIAQFGGDPGNVTIFGQSGGGGKVHTLLQTPAADRLYHKAILMSGVLDVGPVATADSGKLVAKLVVQALGLTKDTIEEIETIPFRTLADAFLAVKPALKAAGHRGSWAPIPGDYYKGDGRKVGFTDYAKQVPILIGSTLAEFPMPDFPTKKDEIPMDRRMALLQEKYGAATQELTALYQQAYPNHNELDLLRLDPAFRGPNLEFADRFIAEAQADLYMYLFAYDFPYNDGEPAWHCSELPYVFHNIDCVPVCHEPVVGPRLQEQFFGAWTAFARTGDPNHPALPAWRPYRKGDEVTMIFDRECRIGVNYDRALIEKAKPFLVDWHK